MKHFIQYLIILTCSYCTAQDNAVKSLIVAEYKKDSTRVGSYTHLVKYNFIQGKFTSKDTILGAPVTRENIPGSYVRFDLGKNFIYNNRFVISGIGNVIDLKTKSLVIEDSDEFVASYGDSLVFRSNNKYKGSGFLILNLKTKSYGFVQDKNYRNIKGLLSPDLKHGIKVDQSTIPYRILLCTSQNSCQTIVSDCGSGTRLLPYSSFIPNVATLWLDNFNFVYAKYSSTVEIWKVNIETKSNDLLGVVDSVPQAISNAYFFTDLNKNLLFTCAQGTFWVDHNHKTLLAVSERNHGNQFTSDLKGDENGVIIRHNNEIIGKLWCNCFDAVTSTDYYAVEYGDPGSNLGYPKGFKVWSSESKKWQTVDVPWLCAIIGWTE